MNEKNGNNTTGQKTVKKVVKKVVKVNGASAKQEAKKPKKKVRMTQQRVIQIVALVIIIAFVGGIASTGLFYLIGQNNNQSQIEINQEYFENLAKEYELKVSEDPTDADSILGLAGTYQQLAVYCQNSGLLPDAQKYFLEAVDAYKLYKGIATDPKMILQADFAIAANLAEAGSLDESEAIYKQLLSSNQEPVYLRLYYAQFLLNNRNDTAGATTLVAEAKSLAGTDTEKADVNDVITQYKLEIAE